MGLNQSNLRTKLKLSQQTQSLTKLARTNRTQAYAWPEPEPMLHVLKYMRFIL